EEATKGGIVRRTNTVLAYLCTGAVLLLFFATAEVFILKQWYQILDAQHQRGALKEEVLRLRHLASDVDNGFRGYVLMRQTLFLAPMISAEQEIPLALERLSRLAETPPSLQGRVQVLRRRLEELVETKRRLVDKIAKGEQEEVLAYVRGGDGVALSKTLAAAFDDLEDKIERQFPSTELSQTEIQKKTLWQLVAVQAGAVFLGVLIMELMLSAFAVS